MKACLSEPTKVVVFDRMFAVSILFVQAPDEVSSHLQKNPASWLSRRSINWLWFLLQQYVIIPGKLAFQIEIFRRLLTAAPISVWQLLFQQSWRKSATWLCPRPATVALWPLCFLRFLRLSTTPPNPLGPTHPLSTWSLALPASREDGHKRSCSDAWSTPAI